MKGNKKKSLIEIFHLLIVLINMQTTQTHLTNYSIDVIKSNFLLFYTLLIIYHYHLDLIEDELTPTVCLYI